MPTHDQAHDQCGAIVFASLAWGLSACGSVRSSQVHAVATLCGIFKTQPRYPLRFATDLARNRSAWLPWITDWSRNAAPGYDQWDVSQTRPPRPASLVAYAF